MSKKATKQNEKPTKGRAKFIHFLRGEHVSKSDALVKTQERYNCPEGLFDKIWKRKAKETSKESKKTTPKKSSSPPPPAKSSESAERGNL